MEPILYHFIESIRWQDIVDITLNSYILFRLYVLFSGTNTLRILIGLGFLWFIQRLAVSVGLVLTSWFIQGITAVAALIIIVVFRNELRSVFQIRYLKTFFFGRPRRIGATPIQITAESVFEMAGNRCGAIIVFPGHEDLREVVHSGIQWNGIISKEMIKSIFWPDNPVHDGACIVEQDRISEVGVILPLSGQKDLPSYLGTRHRAALGLSEKTDALVVVISEETGRISIAEDGRLKTVSRPDSLEQAISIHEGVDTAPHSAGKKDLKYIAAPLIALFIATGAWMTLTKGMETLITLEVPIEYINIDPGMEILETSIHNARVQLSGSEILIKSIRPHRIRVRIDLSGSPPGRHTFEISAENINLPPGVVLNKVDQPRVLVNLDTIVSRTLPVQADWTGALNERLIMKSITIEPARIKLVGPRRILSSLSTLYTRPISLTAIERSGQMNAEITFESKLLEPSPGFKDNVTIKYIVAERE